MQEAHNVQVEERHYSKGSYNTLERFISYYYQIRAVERLNVKSILEIGVGSKVCANSLKEYGLQVTTCDFDKSVLPDIVADVRALPIDDRSFDVSMACQVLEHIPFEDFEKALKELKRVAQKFVVISLPYRSTYFEMVLKFPFIRKIFKRNFFDISVGIPLKFGGFDTSGQHYWEIGRAPYAAKTIRSILRKHFEIIEEFSPVLNKYHRFFILKIKQ
ncbi:MAG: class I SAM-dependent methyltransferase [Patescibacteria group bacterium]